MEATAEVARGALVVRLASGAELPLILSPAGYRAFIDDGRSEVSIRSDCDRGLIPTLPRPQGSGSWYRIPTARALELLGIAYEIRNRVEAEEK